MKFCPECGAELAEGAVKCEKCGVDVNTVVAPVVVKAYDHTAEFDTEDIENNKVYALLGYLLGFIGLIIVFLGAKESKYAMFHAKQALKIEITAILAAIVLAILWWTCIVTIAAIVLFGMLFVVDIIAVFQVFGGKAKEPWLVRSLKFLGK